jgi:penicillin-binding protein 1A
MSQASAPAPEAPRSRTSPPPAAPSLVARTARALLVLLPLLALLIVGGLRLVATSAAFTKQVAVALAEELANKTGASVQLGGVRFDWAFAPCIDDLELYKESGPFKARVVVEEACVERWASALGSGFRATRLRLGRPRIELAGAAVGGGAPALVDVKPSRGAATSSTGRALRELELVFDDLRLQWDGVPVPERFARGSFGPIDGQVTVQVRGGRSAAMLTIREPTTGAEIQGRVTPRGGGWDLSAAIEGDLVPIFGGLLAAAELDIKRLPTHGRLGAFYDGEKKTVLVDLDLAQEDVDLRSGVVAKQRLTGFSARENLRLQLDLGARTLATEDAVLELNGVPFILSLSLAPGVASPRFEVKADLRSVSLARLMRAVPGAEETALLAGLSTSVLFALSFSMSGELNAPATWQPVLEHSLQGLDREGAQSGLEVFAAPFDYYPLTPEGRRAEPVRIGPGTPSWVPYRNIPYVLRRAVIVSEDASFPFHRGIELDEIKNAIQSSLARGQRMRGGSTLTQQLAKNLFLTRDRTALRKLQELILTFHLESALSKDQLFELYMNVIEWGPDLYGIGPAARHYFGRPPEALSPLEMAYLASIIPNPVAFHAHYAQGAVPGAHLAKVHNLLERLTALGQLPAEELERAKASRLVFSRRGS